MYITSTASFSFSLQFFAFQDFSKAIVISPIEKYIHKTARQTTIDLLQYYIISVAEIGARLIANWWTQIIYTSANVTCVSTQALKIVSVNKGVSIT